MISLIIVWLALSPLAVHHDCAFVPGPEGDKKIKAAMKYHGILYAYEISPDVWKFKREGQECSLFTKSFERSYECN